MTSASHRGNNAARDFYKDDFRNVTRVLEYWKAKVELVCQITKEAGATHSAGSTHTHTENIKR